MIHRFVRSVERSCRWNRGEDEISRRSVGPVLILIGVFVAVLSAILFFWAVPVEEQTFRNTGKIESIFIRKDSQVDLSLNPNNFGVDNERGEQLALRVSASGKTVIAVYYENSGALDITLYPPYSGYLETRQVIPEFNVPLTVVMKRPGPVTVTFSNKPSDSGINVTYEVLVSFKIVKVTYPYRESNVYLVVALFGTIIVLFGVYVSFAHKREPSSNRTLQDRAQPSPPKLSYCRYCGATVPQDSIFCKECGRRLKVA